MKTKKLQRICFVLQLKKSKIAAYKRWHKKVWPEQLALLRRAGWNNLTIFVRKDGLLVGYVETPSFKKALTDIAKNPVNVKWQKIMAGMFESSKRPDEAMKPLPEVFRLK